MTRLQVRTLGEPGLLRDGAALPLPASRKTRALLFLLLLSKRPWRREQLCDLFWDGPDDPRASLRWSLSKLRQVLGEDAVRLQAGRELVAWQDQAVGCDLDALRAAPAADAAADLDAAAALALDPPLPGLDLPELPDWSAWLLATRMGIDRLRGEALRRAGLHDALARERRYRYLSEARHLLPGDAELDQALARCRLGQSAELPLPGDAVPSAVATDEAAQVAHVVRYLHTDDGVRLAWAESGNGPLLVKAANWLNHLELDWDSPIWGRLFRELSAAHRLLRYDERGNGLSQWDVDEISFEAFVRDLEALVDGLGLERFPLLGISQGCAVSIEYAARHPHRVSHLVLLGGYAAGWRVTGDARTRAEREATLTLVRHGWGQSNPAYRQIFSHSFFPSGSAAEIAWFDDFQRRTASADNATRFLEAFSTIDVRQRLREVRAPTLVLHARDDQRVAFDHARELAAGIAGAVLVTLDSDSHVPLDREPAHRAMVDRMLAFLRSPAGPA